MPEDQIKTRKIALSELRPCLNCGGQIVHMFRTVEVRPAAFNHRNLRTTFVVADILGGAGNPGALRLAEVMSPGGDEVANEMDDPGAVTKLFLCTGCFCSDLNLALLVEKENERIAKLTERSRPRSEPVEP